MMNIEAEVRDIKQNVIEVSKKIDELAYKRANVPYAILTKIESNVARKPSVQTIAKITTALNVDIVTLIK